jgi:Uma2 family endonuclease
MGSKVIQKRPVVRMRDGQAQQRFDSLAAEEPLEIRVNGDAVSVTMRTPGDDFELALGFCLTEGIVDHPADVAGIRYCEAQPGPYTGDFNVVDVSLRSPAPVADALRRNVYTTSSCGVCGTASIDAVRKRCAGVHDDGLRVSPEVLAALPDDDWRTELVRGRVVREPQPAYEHGRVQVVVAEVLRRHVKDHATDFVCVGNFGVITEEDRNTVRGPDLAIVRSDRVAHLHRAGFLRGAPELVVEIVSPSNRPGAIQAKVAEYLRAGARIVWVIYPDVRTVAVHEAPDRARFLGEGDVLTGGSVLPSLRIDVADVFQE